MCLGYDAKRYMYRNPSLQRVGTRESNSHINRVDSKGVIEYEICKKEIDVLFSEIKKELDMFFWKQIKSKESIPLQIGERHHSSICCHPNTILDGKFYQL